MKFRLLSALVNSLYSFWWDVTNDWGFDLLWPKVFSKSRRPQSPPRPLVLSSRHERSESPSNTSSTHSVHSHPYGLRSPLLFPLPVYPLTVFLDLVLRLTWGIKLSSHLHAHIQGEGSLLIFWVEVAEVVRRWMWVFVRVEWELVRQAREGRPQRMSTGDEGLLDEHENMYEMVSEVRDDRIA
jgi:EXS family